MENAQDEQSRHQSDAPAVPDHASLYGQISPRKRVLSGIPEVSSATDPDSPNGSFSATSSDKEAYRKSMDALNLIEFMRESDMRMAGQRERYLAGQVGQTVETGTEGTGKVSVVAKVNQEGTDVE